MVESKVRFEWEGQRTRNKRPTRRTEPKYWTKDPHRGLQNSLITDTVSLFWRLVSVSSRRRGLRVTYKE